ncbi:hypothetical protein ACOKGD_11765 [Microbacterium phosphatis]|uniref:hypothetical protein n=1 Tax=Microbacterium phosphatis TaxID=3140248 RepID=UPI00314022AA
MNVLFTPDKGKPEVITVTVPSAAEPTIVPMQPAIFEDLTIGFWQSGDSAGVYFQANGVTQ